MYAYRIMVNITFRGFNRFRSHNVYNGKKLEDNQGLIES